MLTAACVPYTSFFYSEYIKPFFTSAVQALDVAVLLFIFVGLFAIDRILRILQFVSAEKMSQLSDLTFATHFCRGRQAYYQAIRWLQSRKDRVTVTTQFKGRQEMIMYSLWLVYAKFQLLLFHN